MIEEKTKTIKFGYGDILVGVNRYIPRMSFTSIKPPVEVGTTVSYNDEDIEICGRVEILEYHIHDLYNLFCTVNEDNKIVKYKDWTFDFTNYNEKSVEVVKKKAYQTLYTLCCAC